jgi:hypothetical protein
MLAESRVAEHRVNGRLRVRRGENITSHIGIRMSVTDLGSMGLVIEIEGLRSTRSRPSLEYRCDRGPHDHYDDLSDTLRTSVHQERASPTDVYLQPSSKIPGL